MMMMMIMTIIIIIIMVRKLQYNSVGIRLKPETMIIIYCSVGIAENVTKTLFYLCTVYLTVGLLFRKM